MSSNLFQILQLVNSMLIPISIVGISLYITKTIERRKLDVLKEKEWQVKWADIFFDLAIEFNKHVSFIICSLYYLPYDNNPKETKEKIYNNIKRLSEINWHIKLSEISTSEIDRIQGEILKKIRILATEGKGELEEVRGLQQDHNELVRKVHAEILKLEGRV